MDLALERSSNFSSIATGLLQLVAEFSPLLVFVYLDPFSLCGSSILNYLRSSVFKVLYPSFSSLTPSSPIRSFFPRTLLLECFTFLIALCYMDCGLFLPLAKPCLLTGDVLYEMTSPSAPPFLVCSFNIKFIFIN